MAVRIEIYVAIRLTFPAEVTALVAVRIEIQIGIPVLFILGHRSCSNKS